MQLCTLTKVSIVTEDTLSAQLKKKICELGATGFTCREVQGYGSRGIRTDQFASNIEFEVICSEPVAHAILTYVSRNYFEQYACIAWLTEVQVVRGARYTEAEKTTP